jgi:hypothetical protein
MGEDPTQAYSDIQDKVSGFSVFFDQEDSRLFALDPKGFRHKGVLSVKPEGVQMVLRNLFVVSSILILPREDRNVSMIEKGVSCVHLVSHSIVLYFQMAFAMPVLTGKPFRSSRITM